MQHFNVMGWIGRALAVTLVSFIVSASFVQTYAHAQPATPSPSTGASSPSSPTQTPGQTSPSSPAPSTANTSDCASGRSSNCLSNPLRYNSLNDLLTAILGAAITLGSIILTLALVWVGFRFVAARGNEEAIKKAKAALMWTVIGGLILLGATAIQIVITSTVSSLTAPENP